MKEVTLRISRELKTCNLLLISIGLIYLIFGFLKFFPSLSPAEAIASQTINRLTFNFISSNTSIVLLAIWETGIGVFLLLHKFTKAILILALIHMLFTFTPLFLMPEATFSSASYTPTLLGQYILKNIIIVAAIVSQLQRKHLNYVKS